MDLLNVRRIKYKAKNSRPIKRYLILFWASLIQIILQIERKLFIAKGTSTVLAFLIFIAVLPILLISCCVLGCYRKIMKLWISWKEGEEIEIADITIRTAMDTGDQDPILSIVFSLEGILNKNVFEEWLEDLIERKDDSGKLVHKHFKCRLMELNGFFAWKIDSNFNLDNHLIVAPSHHHGTTLTDRNIQEYISELCSEHLPKEHSPWQVKLVEGLAEKGVQVTWVVFRLHNLLSAQINLPDYSLSLPNLWDSVYSTKVFTLLEAPIATKKVLTIFENWFNIIWQYFICNLFIRFQGSKVYSKLYPVKEHKEKIFDIICKIKSYKHILMNNLIALRSNNIPDMRNNLKQLIFRLAKICYNLMTEFSLKFYYYSNYLFNNLSILSIILKHILHDKNSEFNILIEAIVEQYWMLRAILSLPRLMMEEIIETKNAAPLTIWRRKGLQKWKRTVIAWSEEIPIEGAKGIQGVSGTSLSCVLITALSGAIRDLLRFSGARSPDNVRCSLPVSIPHTSPHKGLLPLSLPTGCSNGQQALREVSKTLNRMKKYPETYLASAWLIKNLPEFLPEMIFARLLKYLSKSHPVLLINLVGSSSPSHIWGLKLRSTFYWRPPQNDAVLSVCISSYCGNISMGVMADGWSVPHAQFLPQSFVSHLNELAVETGVKLQRKSSNTSSRTSSPRSTPSPSPPSTPTTGSVTNSPYSTLAISMNLKTKLRCNRKKLESVFVESSKSSSEII